MRSKFISSVSVSFSMEVSSVMLALAVDLSIVPHIQCMIKACRLG